MRLFCGTLFVLFLAALIGHVPRIANRAAEYEFVDWVAILITYTLFIGLEVFLFKKFKNYKPKNKNLKQDFALEKQNKENLEKQNENIKEEKPKEVGYFKHISGLPIAENMDCHLYLFDDNIVIKSSGYNFNLSKSKIKDVSIKTDTEIQNQYVSSIGGAVAGACLLGPIGAIIGGRAKQKKSKTITKYLIFTYEKDGEPTVVGFEIDDDLGYLSANKFVKDFRKNYKNNVDVQTIDL